MYCTYTADPALLKTRPTDARDVLRQVLAHVPGHDAREIAYERDRDSGERDSEPVELREHDETAEHGESNCDRERRSEQDLWMNGREPCEHESEQDRGHAVARIEADPGAPHG